MVYLALKLATSNIALRDECQKQQLLY